MFVGKRALYTVRARVGYAWEALKEHVATEDELDFVVSRRRRLTVRLTEAGTGNEIPIRHIFMRWPQAAVSTRAAVDIVEGEAALVLPLLSQVDPDGMAHLTIVSDTSRATTMRIPRAQLQSGPLLRELTLPPRLEGSWTLKLQLREHDGTPFEGSGWLRFVPGDLRRRGGEFQKGRLRLPGLPRHFDELYLVVDGFGFKMNVEPPPAGAEITRSLTLTPPWELVVKPEFEHRPATVYAFYRGVGQSGGGSGVLNRDHGEFTFTGRGDGRWQFYLLDPHGRGSKGLWHKTLTLRGGDRMTLEPKIGVSKD